MIEKLNKEDFAIWELEWAYVKWVAELSDKINEIIDHLNWEKEDIVDKKDWIDEAMKDFRGDEFDAISDQTKQDFREAIEKHMPKVSEELIASIRDENDMIEEEELLDLLRDKWLLDTK